jgi:hypothetical protein
MAKKSKTHRSKKLPRVKKNECGCYFCTGGKSLRILDNRAKRKAELKKEIENE